MAGERILIVDDTPVNLKLTRILLVNEGYTVRTAGSAEEALELLPSYQPRLILADIQLPGMDGIEMTRRIKQDPRTREVIVIALTAFAMIGDKSRAIEAGCEGYITKPIDTRTLGSQIGEVLAQHSVREAEVDGPGGPSYDAAKVDGPGGPSYNVAEVDGPGGPSYNAAEVDGPGGPSYNAAKQPRETLPAAELQALHRRFLQEGRQAARRLLLDLDGIFDAAEAARTVHQLVGTGGLLGYPELSHLAREVEMLLRERPLDAAEVRESLTELLLAFDTTPEAIKAP